MSLEKNLREMERTREAYWRRYPATSPVKLRWRALTVRHCFHVLPGESHSRARRGQRSVDRAPGDHAPRRESDHGRRLQRGPRGAGRRSGTCPTRASCTSATWRRFPPRASTTSSARPSCATTATPRTSRALHRLLKPGGQLLFFEANYWNPQVFLKIDDPAARALGRQCGLPDRDAQVPADEAGVAPGLHARRDRPVRHRPPADARVAHSRRPVDGVHPRTCACRARPVRHALHLAGQTRASRDRASRQSRHAILSCSDRHRSSSPATTKR